MSKKDKWKSFDLLRKEEANPLQPVPQKIQPSSPQNKRRGASLLRNERPPISPPVKPPQPKQDPSSRLGRIRTRRVMRGPDGELYNLTEAVHVWLAQLDEINQIFISDALKSQGYEVTECARLDLLLSSLAETEEIPRLIVVEARAVGQQTPFFRKMLVPKMEEANVLCLITGVTNTAQESSFRSWYEGPLLVGGDLDAFIEFVTELIGPVPD